MRDAAGFLSTDATLASDLTLLAYLLFLLPGMLLGFYFARRKKFSPHHKLVMTTVVIINWILIGFLMLVSYREGVIPYLSAEFNADPRVALPIIHGVIGFTAQVLATYLALRMWFEKVLPRFVMVRNIKVFMRLTLAMWIITAVLGIAIYAVWYAVPAQAGNSDVSPVATPELALAPTPED
ncbi:MAG: hypothetical protein IT298_03060 [Chloroflexi bacterium]|jgi:uncharacterized membrane protein YozB (DUF420 family)|nr:MAG: hypothetical protein UZ13_02759 [Chloroflexi bacterium OLB13]MBW7879029.1 hypothetical protein [Anaerolineae bacterium]MCC6564719.1 hypothetical protein [Chloroflexota bacterium]OQY81693.1 MAG: hypothetical protein B6D42_10755 [Anaerolineae bacterium UTCFX5]MEB2364743.1 hypothetical protein [Chloroflexota bacterium]